MATTSPSRRRVEVIQDDYKRAAQKSSSRCAIARAIKRAFPESQRVMVDVQTIRFTEEGQRYTWLTPNMAQDMIVAFDAGEWSRLEPFSFDLRRDQAFKVQQRIPNEERNKALREGRSEAGPKRPRTKNPRAPRRSVADRAYGLRALAINKYRAQDGLIGKQPEKVPSQA